jgi:hypothetical protein
VYKLQELEFIRRYVWVAFEIPLPMLAHNHPLRMAISSQGL